MEFCKIMVKNSEFEALLLRKSLISLAGIGFLIICEGGL